MLTANDFLYQQYRAYCHYVPLEDVCVLFVIVRNCTDIWFSGGFGGSPFPSSSRWSQRGRSSSCLKLGIHLQGDCVTFDNCTTIAHKLAGASLAVLCPSCCQCQSLSNALLFEPLEPTTMSTSYITSPAETKFFCTSYCCLCPSVTTSLSCIWLWQWTLPEVMMVKFTLVYAELIEHDFNKCTYVFISLRSIRISSHFIIQTLTGRKVFSLSWKSPLYVQEALILRAETRHWILKSAKWVTVNTIVSQGLGLSRFDPHLSGACQQISLLNLFTLTLFQGLSGRRSRGTKKIHWQSKALLLLYMHTVPYHSTWLTLHGWSYIYVSHWVQVWDQRCWSTISNNRSGILDVTVRIFWRQIYKVRILYGLLNTFNLITWAISCRSAWGNRHGR